MAFCILVVDDNPGDIDLVKEALSEKESTTVVHVAENGAEALQFLNREGKYLNAPRPDIVMLDINLPGITGIEVLRNIRSNDALESLPVIMLSSSDAERDIVESYHSRANCYVTKPMDLEPFLKTVQDIEYYWKHVARLPHHPKDAMVNYNN